MEIVLILFLSIFSYLFYPLYYVKFHGKVDEKKGKKLALINSIVLEVIFTLIGLIIGVAPATNGAMFAQGFFYYFIAKGILIDKNKAEKQSDEKQNKVEPKSQNNGTDFVQKKDLSKGLNHVEDIEKSSEKISVIVTENEKAQTKNSEAKINKNDRNFFVGKDLKGQFKKFLIERGYKQFTPSGYPSTVYDYLGRIENVIDWENYNDWSDVAENINKLLNEYSEFGKKAKLGAISHNAVISALRRFKEFIEYIKSEENS